MVKKKTKPRSTEKLVSLDDFLAEQGRREEFEAVAVKEVLTWQATETTKAK